MAKKKVSAKSTLAEKASQTQKTKRGKSTKIPSNREIVYAQGSVRECLGKEAITAKQAQELLGWQEETKENKLGPDYLIKDYQGTKIFCANNITNRPLTLSNVATLKQEILRKRWRFNGEPIIIGKTGLILNGQHQLVGLILAVQEWRANKARWEEFWAEEPTLEKIVVFGVTESDDVINTMDTCKPRTLADVIYRSKYFADLVSKDRSAVSRMTDYAVRFLWARTGASANAFSVQRTHSESLDFIDRHPKIMECVKLIHEENSKNAITRFISPGYAAGLLYLMGCSASLPEKYRADSNETSLDWSLFDKASDFFVLLAANSPEVKAVSTVLTKMHATNENVSVRERWSLLIKAWHLYSNRKPIKAADIELDYAIDADEVNRLAERPTIGGIDCDGEIDPTPDEIIQRKAEVQQRKTATKSKPKFAAKTKVVCGDTVWVHNGDKKSAYKAEVVEVLGNNAKVCVATGYQGAGNTRAARLTDLTVE